MKWVTAGLLVLLIVLQYRLWFGEGSIQDVWRLHRQLAEQRAEMQGLITRNQALEAEVSDLKSGLDAIEERARARLGMINEDETFYQFVRDRAAAAGPESTAGPSEPADTAAQSGSGAVGDNDDSAAGADTRADGGRRAASPDPLPADAGVPGSGSGSGPDTDAASESGAQPLPGTAPSSAR